jgi:hypothetical protein
MKIVHLCLCSFYPDNYSYQENLLPKFHKELGHEVEVIASLQTFDENGNFAYYDNSSVYFNEYNIKVTRLNYRKPNGIFKILKSYFGVSEAISKSRPDVLFIHGVQFLDIIKVIEYVRINERVKIYIDNHADFTNSAKNVVSKYFLHKILWRKISSMIEPYTTKFYGVLPIRVDFLIDVYKLPRSKCELLVMGADDIMVEKVSNESVRKIIRKRYGIKDTDFLIIFGGKIDSYKKQVLLLMKSVNNINNQRIKLLVFGSVTNELKEPVLTQRSELVKYIGWISSEYSYELFASSDLACFPGRHSVFWEQATGQGIPLLVKKWEGTDHIDLGGNVEYLLKDSVIEITEKIKAIVVDKKYNYMKDIAEQKGIKYFSYREIAKRCIES